MREWQAVIHDIAQVPGLDANAKNSKGKTPLHFTAECRTPVAILHELLRTPGIDVNMRDNEGETLLHMAADRRHEFIDELLHAPGIDVNIQAPLCGWTALHYAAWNGNKEVTQKLLQVPGINVCVQDNWGKTAWQVAIQYNHKEIAYMMKKYFEPRQLLTFATAAHDHLGTNSPAHNFASDTNLVRLLGCFMAGSDL